MEIENRVVILQDLRIQSFDTIRFASYRTACKLRYVQKACNLHLVDIWNVIEAFRENGLNTLEPQNEVSVARLETLISSLYHNLNKRLPSNQQVTVDSKASLLLNWLLSAYTNDNSGIRVFSIKVALAIMCAGKLVDKLRYIFSQISDGGGQLIHWKSTDFIREILALPAAVYETPTFHYEEGLENELFPIENKITVNDFISTLVNEPGPSSLVWLSLVHRLATVENVVHPTICSACHRENFTGFRYRCQRCHGYQLCQDCFWQGKVSLNHQNDHEVKEYSCYKSPSKQFGNSLRKSFRCVPEKSNQGILPKFPDQPEKTLNLSHIVPPSPLPSHHNGFSDGFFERSSTLDSRATGRSLDSNTMNGMGEQSMQRTFNSSDDPHTMMARYAARLAKEAKSIDGGSNSSQQSNATTVENATQRSQRELISQLENKNKEIMREIQRLRQQEQEAGQESPQLVTELRALRQRKGELEGHLGALQDSRRQLMQQLEGLMKLLKNHQTQSPRSTPNSSPRSGKSPPMPQGPQQTNQQPIMRNGVPQNQQQQSIPSNQQLLMLQQQQQQQQNELMNGQNGNGLNNNGGGGGQNVQNDLHYAADSVSNAMSSLVRELNTEPPSIDRNMMYRRQYRDFEEAQQQQQKMLQQQQPMKSNGNNGDWNKKDNPHWQDQFAQWNLNN